MDLNDEDLCEEDEEEDEEMEEENENELSENHCPKSGLFYGNTIESNLTQGLTQQILIR